MAAYSSYGAMSLALPCSKGQQHLQQQQRQEGHFRLWFEAPSSEKQVSAPCLLLPVEPVSLTNLRNMCHFGDLDEAVQTLALLDRRGFPVSRDTFYSLLLECTRKKDVACGRRLYILMASNGLDSVAALGDHLVRLFAMCGSLQEAALVFWKLADRTVHTWQAIISAHAVQGEHVRALEYYHIMLQEGVMPNRFIFPGVLKACGNIGALEQGELIHDKVVQCGFELDVFTGNTLVDMYAKCGCLKEAREVFDDLQQRDVVSWNAMIEGYAHRGHSSPALEFFQRMQQEGIKPSRASFLGALKACWMAGDIKQGRQIHEQIRECGLHLDTAVRNTLIYMYAKCGTLEMAGKLFNESKAQDVVSWNAIMVGVQQHGNAQAALELFNKMQEKGIKPDKITFSCVLKACSSVGALEQGKMVHKKLMGSGYESDTAICSALVDMYAKCGSLEEARTLFDNLPARDIVSWGAIITGYAQRGDGVVALDLFDKMQDEGIMPNRVVLLCAVKACCSVGAIAQGKLIHGEVIGNGLESDVMIGSTLIEMYARCGCLEEACEVFLELPDKDVIAWGVMIGAYAQHGKSGLAVQCLKDMQEQGLRPDGMIYTTILTSCSHAGQVEEGQQLFKSMRELHGIFPDVEHLNCMADLLGRTGHLYEAEELLEIMPIPPVLSGWMSLLSACRAYGNVNLGRECFDQVVSLDANYSASYVVMSNIYADAQMWDNAHKLRNSRKCASAWRKPGRAWIEVNRKIHEFTVGDKTHPASVDIYAKSNELRMAMKQEGYVPQLALVLDSVSEEDKEEALFGHCEKLAICFGLLVTAKGATIRVTKNLRVCRDCHNASKIISKIENRQIIISDSYRVHNFEEGVCSCGDVF